MKYVKLKPSDTTVDHRYQRELDAKRVEAMAQGFVPELVGVPVVSKREDGSYVRIDGQHRLAAQIAAGQGDEPILMEVVDGLTIRQEAELFLRLNGGRKAVGALDKYKARIEAREPVALEIQGILKKHGCRIASGNTKGIITAVQAVEFAYHAGNLDRVVYVLAAWHEREPVGFDGSFIRGVSRFLSMYPDADDDRLVKSLSTVDHRRLLTKIKNESRQSTPAEGAVYVIVNIYNHKAPKAQRLPGLAHQALAMSAVN